MTYPQQQNMSFPDTIAICLDEDKSMVNKFINKSFYYYYYFFS
jgi:hypothetical protein